ncbi:MAG: cyclic nucleotide-binding domain-containing protein [Verrucomicrobiota bacterium]|nr:cyclic nucleotide-binding domain-containing protein [Verrucomicrobiota bacterium]
MKPRIFKEIGPQLGILQLRTNQIVFREGDPGNSLYLVGKGCVRISRRGGAGVPDTIGFVESGNFFGATALLEKEPRSTTAVATEASVLGTVKEKTFQQILELAPTQIHLNFLRSVNERMRGVNTYFMNEVLRTERLRVVDAVADSILRDLTNPVCIARCCSDLIRSEITDTRLRDLSKMLGNAVNGLLSSAQDLLDYARGCVALDKQYISIGQLFDKLDHESLGLLPRKDIELIKHIRYEGNLLVDLPRLMRVLCSLIQNASEAMAGGGNLTITADRVHDQIALRISDTGAGIAPELLAKAFEPFGVRNHTHRSSLSLAIAKSIVEAHGGKICVASVQGKGTTVDIRLPRPASE